MVAGGQALTLSVWSCDRPRGPDAGSWSCSCRSPRGSARTPDTVMGPPAVCSRSAHHRHAGQPSGQASSSPSRRAPRTPHAACPPSRGADSGSSAVAQEVLSACGGQTPGAASWGGRPRRQWLWGRCHGAVSGSMVEASTSHPCPTPRTCDAAPARRPVPRGARGGPTGARAGGRPACEA